MLIVAGDKSNHVVTLNSPQMLYIWPYIAFFSFPLLTTPLLSMVINYLPDSKIKAACEKRLGGPSKTALPNLVSILLFMIVGLVAVHLNTVVHPFTLADNRHYVFYIFRILRRHLAIKYLAVPVYVVSGWLAIRTLAQPSTDQIQSTNKAREPVGPVKQKNEQLPHISFIIVWLATSTLSLVTAPLVEPRYFIIPWLIWRLHVPSSTASSLQPSPRQSAFDPRLVLETVWLLAINAAVGYNFLYRGFSWQSEPGVQRFLW